MLIPAIIEMQELRTPGVSDMYAEVTIHRQQVQHRVPDVVRRKDGALVGRPEAHKAEPRDVDVPVAVANVKLPSVMRQSAVSFQNQAALDDEVDPAYSRNIDLDLIVQARRVQH